MTNSGYCVHMKGVGKESLETCPRAGTGTGPGGFACCLGSSAKGRKSLLLAPAGCFELVWAFHMTNPAGGGHSGKHGRDGERGTP